MVGVLVACNLSKMMSKASMFEGTEAQDAAAAFKKKIGGPIKALSVKIDKDAMTLQAQDPRNPQHVDEYKYSRGLVIGPSPVELNSMDRNLDKTLFDLDELNLAATPALAKAAVERTRLEGGKVTKMEIERVLNLGSVFEGSASELSKSGRVAWRVTVDGPREHASVVANTKGDITGVDLSQTAQAAKANYYEGDAMSGAVTQIKEAFGGRVKLLELVIYDKYVWFQAQDPQKPEEFNQYKCDISGVSRARALSKLDLRSSVGLDNKVEDALFDLDEVNFGKTADLAKATLDKLQIDGGTVRLMKVSRELSAAMPKSVPSNIIPREPNERDVKWEIHVTGARAKSGYVIYDSQGNQKKVKAAE
jgi:hypothetical protein